ncbi:MAG: hypothetical protein RR213_07455, partial [Raoultibacter sp.]
NKGLALVLAAVLALTPMAGFPVSALATGEVAAPQAEAPATDAADAPAAEALTADADTPADAAPGTTPSTPVPLDPTPTVDPTAATGVAINETNFPDHTFRTYVKDNFDTEKNGKKDGILEADEINDAIYIGVNGKGITTLQGVEYLTNLTYLDCGKNQLTTLDVSKNT